MTDEKKQTKFLALKFFMQPFDIIFNNFKSFVVQGACFSLFVVLISYLLGQKYLCVFNKGMVEHVYCPNLTNLYLLYLLLKIVGISLAINVWYNTVFKGCVVDKEYLVSNLFAFLKAFLFAVAFIVLNMIPMVSVLLLVLRVPNPIWQIEIVYFSVVSLGFIIPFVLMRFYSLFALLLGNENWKQFKLVWHNTCGYTFKIIFSCSLTMLFCLILLLSARNLSTQLVVPFSGEMHNFIAETIFSFVCYFIVILFINFFEVQKRYFMK